MLAQTVIGANKYMTCQEKEVRKRGEKCFMKNIQVNEL